MRVLLIAYEFTPSPSPQSLRWAYLARGLVWAGHEVHVLTTEPTWVADGLPELPEQMRIHRVTGGPITSMMAMLARRQEAKLRARGKGAQSRSQALAPEVATVPSRDDSKLPSPAPTVVAPRESRLNWKGRLVERLKPVAMSFLFPDTRGEWYFPAREALERLLEDIRPDVVVSSHEPATTLELGIHLKRRHRIPWLADLGDPVLADYTPRRWHRRALRVERRVMRLADGITVTAPGTRQLLLERHGAASGVAGIEVLSQGFDDQGGSSAALPEGFFDRGLVELLYTGSFYQFRRPDALIDAVLAVPGVRLNVAASVIPDWLRQRFEAQPDKFRLLGFMPHVGVLVLQRQADVLVNIANDNPCQVPGKIYEYLGAGRPILHTGNIVEEDVSASLIRGRRRGWVCGNREDAQALLRTLVERKRAGRLDPEEIDLDAQGVAEFGWSRQAQRLARMLASLVEEGRVSLVLPAGQGY